MFLCNTRQEAGRVNKRDQRNIEAIAHADEASHLVCRVYIDHTCHDGRFLSHDTNTMPADASQPHDRVTRPAWLEFKERSLIDDLLNHLVHDVWLGRVNWDNTVQGLIHQYLMVFRLKIRRIFNVIRWQI